MGDRTRLYRIQKGICNNTILFDSPCLYPSWGGKQFKTHVSNLDRGLLRHGRWALLNLPSSSLQHIWSTVSYHNLIKNYRLGSKVYSLLFIGTALASFIGLLVANLILPIFGWAVVYMFFAIVCLTSLILLLLFEEKPTIQDNNVSDYYKMMVES